MSPSVAPLAYKDLLEGKLIAAVITSTTTGVKVKVKQINGVTPTWTTIAHRVKVLQRTATMNKAEIWNVAAGTTQSGQTVTLGTLTRAIPLDDGTDFTGSGTAQSFFAGADVFLTWDSHDAAQSAKLDLDNVFTGDNTFSGDMVNTGSLQVPVFDDATARDAAITSPANGMLAYLTDEGVMYQYIGGSWTTFATGTTSNASTTVAGKVEAATVAEQASHAAAGDTGALAVPTTDKLVTLSSDGTWASGAIPTLNTSKYVDVSLLGSGTASSATFLRGDGTWQSIRTFGTGADGAITMDGTTATVVGRFTKVDGTHYRLDADCNFTDLTIDSGIELNPNGFRFYCTGTLTLGGGDNIVSAGGNGGNATAASGTTAGTAGSAATAAHTSGTLPNSKAGGAGGIGGAGGTTSGAGNVGANTTGANNTIAYGSNGVGSAGASGGANSVATPGRAGGSSTGGTASMSSIDAAFNATRIAGVSSQVHTASYHAGNAGGGGGGSGTANTSGANSGAGGGGGGAGADGGDVDVSADTITGTGNVKAPGGNGGNAGAGGNGSGGGGGGAGGAGAAGNGGFVKLRYRDKSGWSGTATAAAGTPGAGAAAGTGGGGGSDGGASNTGTAGLAGKVLEFVLS